MHASHFTFDVCIFPKKLLKVFGLIIPRALVKFENSSTVLIWHRAWFLIVKSDISRFNEICPNPNLPYPHHNFLFSTRKNVCMIFIHIIYELTKTVIFKYSDLKQP